MRTALDRAATRIEGKFNEQPLVEASIHMTIANGSRELGLFPEAQRHFERSVHLRRRVLGLEHPDTLTSDNNLGQLYRQQGNYAQAEQVLTPVMQTRNACWARNTLTR